VVGTPVRFDGSNSRPLGGLDTYTWDFGDGTPTATGATVSHAYSTPGDYSASLTVTGPTGSAMTVTTVDIGPTPTANTGLRITVTNESSEVVSGADVAVINADGVRYSASTNSSGVAVVNGLPDSAYTAYAWKDGYKPKAATVQVTGGIGTATIALAVGSVAQTDMTSTRLAPDELPPGLDPEDPANQNVYQFSIHLAFGTGPTAQPLELSGYSTENGVFEPVYTGGAPTGDGCAAVGGYVACPSVQYSSGPTPVPSVVWMIIPGTAKWLKEFFDVHVVVSNLADPEFTFEHGEVSLAGLPAGLSLAPTAAPQSLTTSLADIPGQESEGAGWVLRGDAEGFYTLAARYTGTLEPVGAALDLPIASPPNALHVWGGSAVEMIVDADDQATLGYPYLVNVGLKNVADVPVYNPAIELSNEGRLNSIYQPRERLAQSTSVIQPGATFMTHYRLVPEISGVLDVSQSFVAKTGGNATVATNIVSHPATPIASVPTVTTLQGDGIHVVWQAVAGASRYEIYATPTRDIPFTNTPVVTATGTSAVLPFATAQFLAISAVDGSTRTMHHPLIDWHAAPIGGAISARELALFNDCYSCAGQFAHDRVKANMRQNGIIDPVDTGTGVLTQSYTDLEIGGRGPSLVMTHGYSSVFAADDGPLGFGWSFAYGAHVRIAPNGDATVAQESGAEVVFNRNADGTFSAAPRVIARLVLNADGTFTFVRHKQLTMIFDATGRLTQVSDRNGYATALSYTGDQLATVTNSVGRQLHFTWSAGHISNVIDDTGRQVTYNYSDGNLVEVVDPNGGHTVFAYGAGHFLTEIYSPRQYGVADPQALVYAYDTEGRVTDQTDPAGGHTHFEYAVVDPDTTTTLVTDPLERQTLETYEFGLRISSVRGYGTTDATTTSYTFDRNTLGILMTRVDAPGDPNHYVTTATYNASGLPVVQKDALGRTTTHTYNSSDDILTTTTPNPSAIGATTVTVTNTYDTKGNLVKQSVPLYTSPKATKTLTTTYVHGDAVHPEDVTAVIDPAKKTTTYSYAPTGELRSTLTPKRRLTTFTSDALGRLTNSVSPRGNAKKSAPANFQTTYAYDARGLLVRQTTANQPAASTITLHYDLDGNLDRQVDADGRITTYEYSPSNQLLATHRANGSTITQDYWPDGKLHHQYDAALAATNYTYDALGRRQIVSDPLGRPTTYTYRGNDQQATKTDADGRVTTFDYNQAGDLTGIDYSDPQTRDVTFAYGRSGLRSAMNDASGTSTYAYDNLGRTMTLKNGSSATLTYTYDPRGQIKKIGYPNGKTVVHTYDPDGEMTAIKDWLGNKTKFSYDLDSDLTTIKYPNGVIASKTYDNAGRPIKIVDSSARAGTLASFTYTRTAAGLLNSDSHAGVPGPTETFSYDSLNRLSSVNGSPYTFDAADNLTGQAGSPTSAAFDRANQLCWTGAGGGGCDAPPEGATTYAYDVRGNRTATTPGTGPGTTFSYDQANRLTSASSVNATYTYNGDGLRTAKSVDGSKTNFTWDVSPNLPLLVQDGTRYIIYGPGDVPLEQINSTTVQYLHQDQLNSSRLVSSATGTAVGRFTYDAYGKRTDATGSVTTNLGFNGQYADPETGLIYLRARYYDSATGQFLTGDPLGLTGTERYGYGSSSPLNWSDPRGLCSWNPFSGHDCYSAGVKDTVAAGVDLVKTTASGDLCVKGMANCQTFAERHPLAVPTLEVVAGTALTIGTGGASLELAGVTPSAYIESVVASCGPVVSKSLLTAALTLSGMSSETSGINESLFQAYDRRGAAVQSQIYDFLSRFSK
jgi:RHS repeat-associated protein